MASYLSIGITQNSQSVANNTSNVTVTVSIYSEASWNYDAASTAGSYCTINGTKHSFTHTFTTGTTTIFTWTGNIPHNADGTKTLSVYASFYTDVSLGTLTKSASKVLTTIPRATQPTLSASSVNLGSDVTITMNRASSSFTHTLEYSFGSASGTIGTGLATSKAWTVPLNLAAQIPNATSGTVTITCKTYNGSTLIGTKTVNLTVNVPSTVVPTISGISVADTVNIGSQTLLEKYSAFVQNKSIPKATINASASYSTIKQYKVTYQGTSVLTSTNEVTLGLLTQTESVKITVEVTDGRGRTTTRETTITSLAYSPPAVSATVIRCDSDGTANDDGAYMKVACKTTISALNNANGKSVVLNHKKKTVTSWTAGKTWAAYSVDESVIIAADVNSSYDIQLVATDDFSGDNPATFTAEIGTTKAIMDFKSDGKGMSIGKAAENDGLEVDWDAQFNKNINIDGILTAGAELDMTTDEIAEINTSIGTTGNRLANFLKSMALKLGLIADYIVERGTSGIWTYEKWNSGKAVCWGTKTGNLSRISTYFNFPLYAFTDVAFPSSLFIEPPKAFPKMRIGTSSGGTIDIRYNVDATITKDKMTVYGISETNATQACRADIYAIGRWK